MSTRTPWSPQPAGRAPSAAPPSAGQGSPHTAAAADGHWLHRAMAVWVRDDAPHPAPPTTRRGPGRAP
ncbi:hypothetical protein [Aquabacterium olei]|uniref:hypothetical protein n=1 Tax=Aquabacterium olei TaxID=1296669 RepID=UPI00131F36AF|nr:hypothetical protein [Aquabacterium olei]